MFFIFKILDIYDGIYEFEKLKFGVVSHGLFVCHGFPHNEFDGQNLRHDLNKGLPQDRAGRTENWRRAAHVGRQFNEACRDLSVGLNKTTPPWQGCFLWGGVFL